MKKTPRSNWARPHSLHEVVHRADTTEDVGCNLAEFLDHVNFLIGKRASRPTLFAGIRREPPRTGDAIQDAYLAAVAAHLSNTLRLPLPRWTDKKNRRLDRPWFALPYPWARAELLRSSPAAFRERNLFTTENALHRA